ncbi:MAG TPA: hypothetical protein PKC28_10390, partial [Bdellovibrionales bacterium]|nr:hypothetical protein [Bdellovibrionales bacterium]
MLFVMIIAAWSAAGAAPLQETRWRRVEHQVEYGDTLRLIARRYIGVKEAAPCLQNQLRLAEPNQIGIGDRLSFFAPPKTYSLAEYRALEPVCTPGMILVNGQEVTGSLTEVAPPPLPAPPSAALENDQQNDRPDPESLYALKRISHLRA